MKRFDIAGKVVPSTLKLSMSHNNKRYWPEGFPKTAEDLLNNSWSSEPLMIEEVLLQRSNKKK